MNRPVAQTSTPEDFEEFKLLVESSRDYLDAFLKGAALYFAIIGIGLKVFFDAPAGSSEQRAVYFFGNLVNGWAVFVCLFSAIAQKGLIDRSYKLAQELGRPNVYTRTSVAAAFAIMLGILGVTIFWALLYRV